MFSIVVLDCLLLNTRVTAYFSLSLNSQNTYPSRLSSANNSIVCHSDTTLFTTVFGFQSPPVRTSHPDSKRCKTALQKCHKCLDHDHCQSEGRFWVWWYCWCRCTCGCCRMLLRMNNIPFQFLCLNKKSKFYEQKTSFVLQMIIKFCRGLNSSH